MKTSATLALAASLMASMGSAQSTDFNGNYNIAGITITPDAITCLTSCPNDIQNLVNLDTFVTCGDQSAVDKVNSCIQDSSCDSSDKPKASSLISSICSLGTSAAALAGLESATTSSSPASNTASATGSDTSSTSMVTTSPSGDMAAATTTSSDTTDGSSSPTDASVSASSTGDSAASSLKAVGAGAAGLSALAALVMLL